MKMILRCKTCGKIIAGCSSCNGKVFSWKNVACCEEHFQQYVQRVESERNNQATKESGK
jgi:hypothetical protein